MCHSVWGQLGHRHQNTELGFSLHAFALSFDTNSPWLCLLWACGQPWLCPAFVWEWNKVHDPGVPSHPLLSSHIIFRLIPQLGPPANGAKGSRPVLAAAPSQKVSHLPSPQLIPFVTRFKIFFSETSLMLNALTLPNVIDYSTKKPSLFCLLIRMQLGIIRSYIPSE